MIDYTTKTKYIAETPPDVAIEMVKLAELKYYHSVLEPSAGTGALVAAIFNSGHPEANVSICEMNDKNRKILLGVFGEILKEKDFLRLGNQKTYDRIIMNPPFKGFSDVTHILKAYSLLKPDGKLVALIYKDFETNNASTYQDFRTWLEMVPHKKYPVDNSNIIPPGVAIILVIDKFDSLKYKNKIKE